jgi:Skp family chaperone for outer membrane proteins
MDLIFKVFNAFVAVIITLCSALQRSAKAVDNVAHVAEKHTESWIPSDEDYSKSLELATARRQANLAEQESDLAKQLEKFNKQRKPTNKPTDSDS